MNFKISSLLLAFTVVALSGCGISKPKKAADQPAGGATERPTEGLTTDICLMAGVNICDGSGAPEDLPATPALEALTLTSSEITIPVKILEVLPRDVIGDITMKEFGGIIYFPEDSAHQFDSNYVLSNREQRCEQNCWILDPYNQSFMTAKAEQIRSASGCAAADSIEACTQRYFERLSDTRVHALKGVVKQYIQDAHGEAGASVQRRYKIFEVRDVVTN